MKVLGDNMKVFWLNMKVFSPNTNVFFVSTSVLSDKRKSVIREHLSVHRADFSA